MARNQEIQITLSVEQKIRREIKLRVHQDQAAIRLLASLVEMLALLKSFLHKNQLNCTRAQVLALMLLKIHQDPDLRMQSSWSSNFLEGLKKMLLNQV